MPDVTTHAGNPGDPDTGAITARGRFERMEQTLARIEEKLDTKADEAELTMLTRQVLSLERIDSNRVAAADALLAEKTATASALKEYADVRYRTLMWIVGVATFVSMAISASVAIANIMNLH